MLLAPVRFADPFKASCRTAALAPLELRQISSGIQMRPRGDRLLYPITGLRFKAPEAGYYAREFEVRSVYGFPMLAEVRWLLLSRTLTAYALEFIAFDLTDRSLTEAEMAHLETYAADIYSNIAANKA